MTGAICMVRFGRMRQSVSTLSHDNDVSLSAAISSKFSYWSIRVVQKAVQSSVCEINFERPPTDWTTG